MIHQTHYLGHDLTLLIDEPDWGQKIEIRHRVADDIETGRTGRESRRPRHVELRHEISLTLSFARPESAQAWQTWLASPFTGYIGYPLPMDLLPAADYADRIYDAQHTLVMSPAGVPSLVATAGINTAALPAGTWLAPLFVGRLKSRPVFKALTDMHARVTLSLLEESPWAFRLAPFLPPGTPATPLDWPDAIGENWSVAPEDSTSDILDFTSIGQARVKSVDGREGAVRRAQKFTATLDGRAQIRALLAFFLARRGRVEAFTAPWLFRPSDANTPLAPHSTRARFANDTITLSWLHDQAANASISLLQVPQDAAAIADGESPSLPAEAFLYIFTLRIPGEDNPMTWRYTDWENDITWENQTWLGDTAGLIHHDAITQTDDLSDPAVTLTLSAGIPRNPVALIASGALDAPLQIEILSCIPHTAAGLTTANAITPLYTGDISEVSANGSTLTAKSRVLGGLLENKVPAFVYSETCNHRFCGPGCNRIASTWTLTAAIESQAGSVLTLTDIANPYSRPLSDNFYTRGVLISSSATDWEIRQILSSVQVAGGKIRLTLRSPLRHITTAAGAPLVVSFRPDCSGTWAECMARQQDGTGKWHLYFGGHPHIGPGNLSLPSYNTSEAMGKK